jgi:hypothetical protein
MRTIEITDPKEARRCRYAQYRGEKATLMLNGLSVTGMVCSVREDNSNTPMRSERLAFQSVMRLEAAII